MLLLAEELGRVDGWVCTSIVVVGGIVMLAYIANWMWDRYLTHQQHIAEINARANRSTHRTDPRGPDEPTQ